MLLENKLNSLKNICSRIGAVVIATVSLLFLTGAHHFLSGLAVNYPEYDLTDAYVFEAERPEYTAFILGANPSTPGSSDKNTETVFGNGGLYNLHIATDDKIEQGFTLTFSFDQDKATIGLIDNPNAAIGEQGETIGSASAGETFELDNGIKGWAGRVNEPFFGNGAGLGAHNANKAKGVIDPEAFNIEQPDLFTGATNSSIVVEVPNTMLGDQVKFFITTAAMHKGEWAQVNREANVLMPYVFFADSPAVQEDHDQHRPDSDIEERRQAMVNNIFYSVSVSQSISNPLDYANQTADLLMPDVLNYTPGTKAEYSINNLNGRSLADDAMNVALELMHGMPVDDYADPSGNIKIPSHT